MKALLAIPALLLMGGCVSQSATLDDQVKVITALSNAGCTVSVHVAAQGATGQLGGGASAGFSGDGSCDPSKAHAGLQVGQVVSVPSVVTAPASVAPVPN